MSNYISNYTGAQIDAAVGKARNHQHMTNVTWAELKALRDSNSLEAGCFYRITDYVTKVYNNSYNLTQFASAEHPFDVIVLALDSSRLSEEAWAALHEGDTYFANSNLNAWRLWYKLDNTGLYDWSDASGIIINGYDSCLRIPEQDSELGYAWLLLAYERMLYTTTENPTIGDVAVDEYEQTYNITGIHNNTGKGVIYRMIDEFGNEAPYDFKNIVYYKVWDSQNYTWKDSYSEEEGVRLCYTFSLGGDGTSELFVDRSVIPGNTNGYAENNVIKSWHFGVRYCLNNVILFGGSKSNFFDSNCHNITLSGRKDDPSANIYDYGSYNNTFGKHNVNINFYGYGFNNEIGYDCSNIAMNVGCNYNIIGHSCSNISMGWECLRNTFEASCRLIYFGSYCRNNHFGLDTSSITFATTATGNSYGLYFCYNIIDPGTNHILLYSATPSDSKKVQYYHIKVSATPPSGTEKIAAVRDRTYETTIARKSNGVLRLYCEDDLT